MRTPNRIPHHAKPADGRARHARGLTLIEVLASVGIISALMVLAIPALERARSTARDVRCMNRLRHMGILMQNYIDQKNGKLPPFFYDVRKRASGALDVQIVPRDAKASGWGAFEDTAWVDPEDRNPSPAPLRSGGGTVKSQPTSYSYNIDLLRCGGSYAQIADQNAYSEITVFHDGGAGVDTAGTYASGRDYASSTAQYRHSGHETAHILFADWHVESTDAVRNRFSAACEGVRDRQRDGLHGQQVAGGFGPGGTGAGVTGTAGGGGQTGSGSAPTGGGAGPGQPLGGAPGAGPSGGNPAGGSGTGQTSQASGPGSGDGHSGPGQTGNAGSSNTASAGPGNPGGPSGQAGPSQSGAGASGGSGGPPASQGGAGGHSNNGHGNNADGVDASNPGQGQGGPTGANNSGNDPSGGVDDEASGGGALPSRNGGSAKAGTTGGGGNDGGGSSGGNGGSAETDASFAADHRSVTATSTKDLSNVVLELASGEHVKYEGLSGRSGTFSAPGNERITGVWIKSGHNASGDGPGYGEYHANPNL